MPSSTILLSRTITLTSQFIRNAPLAFTNSDPALANADWVRQFVLAAPFAWRWNRHVTTFTTVPNQQDYVVVIPTFGWLEQATFYDATESLNSTKELTVELVLSECSQPGEPTHIAAQLDDGAGNITFRITPPPPTPLTIALTWQAAAPLFTSPTLTWAPIPDYLSYLYNQGFLAKCYEYMGDERFGIAMQLFLKQVVAANDGLDETQRNIFLPDRMNTQRETQQILGNSQMARGARVGS